MDTGQLSMAGGLLLGFASSLHCAGMCGGLSAGFLMLLDTPTPASRVRALTLLNLGRLVSYVLAGTLFGALGASVVGILPKGIAFKLLQWGGAMSLMWIGLSTAGLMPNLAVADRILAPVSTAIQRLVPRNGGLLLAPVAMGVAWGFLPCAMVYGALLTAMLTGSALLGAGVMLGFALGTVPAVAATSLGLRTLAGLDGAQHVRSVVGLAIAGLGLASIYLPHVNFGALCW